MKRMAPMIVIIISLSGCFGLTDEQQAESDKLSLEYAEIMKQYKGVLQDVKDGKISPVIAFKMANDLLEKGKVLEDKIVVIQAKGDAPKWKVYLSWAANAVLIATTGAAGIKYRNILVNVVRAVHKVRKRQGSVEDVVDAFKGLGHKGLNKAAEKLPDLDRRVVPPAPKPPEAEAA